jgi:hypothetical protein
MSETVLYPRKRPRMYTPARDAFLRANVGIDPAILAAELGVSIRFVCCYQRKLGLRLCTSHVKGVTQ